MGATLHCGEWTSHCGGFSYCGAWALGIWVLGTQALGTWAVGTQALSTRAPGTQALVVVARGPGCPPTACGIFPD